MMKSRLDLMVLLLLVLTFTVVGQDTYTDPAKDFYRLTRAAPAAFDAGDHDSARNLANALLVEAEKWKGKNWNYGNAIHTANLVLGRIALLRSEVPDARRFLLAAGRTPGSPQLNTFGPDMLFAQEMLHRGESATVLAYFDLCEKFWTEKRSKLTGWRSSVTKGELPEFGANLRYIFTEQRQ